MAAVERSIIRWAGSKKKLLPVLRAVAPKQYQRYIEPFCGSICFYVDQQPTRAILSDNNSELIQFYKSLSYRPLHIGKLAHAMPNTERYYYELRNIDPSTLSANDRAARFLYLNRFCFNGVYRTNKSGRFNVPRGSHMGALPELEEIQNFGRLIRSASFYAADFETILDMAGHGDFVYLDPPYAGRDVRDRGEYGANAFKEPDIQRLADSCHRASARGAKVLLSYADIRAIQELMDGWNIHRLSVPRSVSGFARGRTTVNEILVSNYS
ncbi:Dam family site-specific DNA-(adenine-N6)-methyltransferase [Herbaspirillum huttiense]|uniref:DNA adenine methylase n=1 Tax=Herbaspirillum huttiense TaxID=863372 RepID=UPI002E7A3768|nr:Dam family site-specific DNA-(adenine-N6)-methyltransferase [Herbaspirillum huttiense]MEE1636927.1 Dam family site-specific DNA-(adenine-N6)-methyltransferase [Herbaspirillum huttiense NC40101]